MSDDVLVKQLFWFVLAVSLIAACDGGSNRQPVDSEATEGAGSFNTVAVRTATATPSPTATAVNTTEPRWHPRGTRTGVSVVDAVLHAVEERDQGEFEGLIRYERRSCVIPQDGAVDIKGARIVAESWKEFGLQKPPPPVDGVIDMSYLQEARK